MPSSILTHCLRTNPNKKLPVIMKARPTKGKDKNASELNCLLKLNELIMLTYRHSCESRNPVEF